MRSPDGSRRRRWHPYPQAGKWVTSRQVSLDVMRQVVGSSFNDHPDIALGRMLRDLVRGHLWDFAVGGLASKIS